MNVRDPMSTATSSDMTSLKPSIDTVSVLMLSL